MRGLAFTRRRAALPALCLLTAIAGCALPAPEPPLPAFEGQSATDGALRQDILGKAGRLFEAAAGCPRIERVEVSVLNIRMMFKKKILNGKTLSPLPSGGFLLDKQKIPARGYVREDDESWRVTGCGTSRDFHIKLFGDDSGNTYAGVFDPEKHPLPE